jgi:hypothetical protein
LAPEVIGYVLDAAAMLRYGSSPELGRLLFGAVETDTVVALPLISLAEAYRRASEEQVALLDALCGQPAVGVLTPDADDALALGGIAASVGDLNRAHAVVEAMRQRAVLLSPDADALRLELPDGWPVVEL